jgi:hypothetical protein
LPTTVLGSVRVTSGRLCVGDPGLPPPGTVIDGVPPGVFEITARTVFLPSEDPSSPWVAEFRIRFEDPPAGEESTETFSIDSGVVFLCDPLSDAIPPGWWARRRARRALFRRVLDGVRNLWYADQLTLPDGQPLASSSACTTTTSTA